jgi:hypothetical protein
METPEFSSNSDIEQFMIALNAGLFDTNRASTISANRLALIFRNDQ